MKVVVDELRCDAHGVCVDACPEVFALDDDDDLVRVLVDEPGRVAPGEPRPGGPACARRPRSRSRAEAMSTTT